MSNHPNRNWKRRWTVDERSMEARHECGLIVQFVAHHAGGFNVHSPNEADIVAALAASGEARPADRLKRLTEESVKLFVHVLSKRQRER